MLLQERIYIIGPHGGKAGSQAITNFTEHNHSIFDHPDATTPIPYTELMITAVPCYRAKKVTGACPPPFILVMTGVMPLYADVRAWCCRCRGWHDGDHLWRAGGAVR